MGFSRQEFWSGLPLLALEPSKTRGWCPGPGLMAALRWCVLVPPGPGPTHGCSRRLRLRSRRHTPPLAAGPHPRRSCGGLQGSPGGGQVSAGQRNTVKLPRTVCQASQGTGDRGSGWAQGGGGSCPRARALCLAGRLGRGEPRLEPGLRVEAAGGGPGPRELSEAG